MLRTIISDILFHREYPNTSEIGGWEESMIEYLIVNEVCIDLSSKETDGFVALILDKNIFLDLSDIRDNYYNLGGWFFHGCNEDIIFHLELLPFLFFLERAQLMSYALFISYSNL
jgi:hypothetical protein